MRMREKAGPRPTGRMHPDGARRHTGYGSRRAYLAPRLNPATSGRSSETTGRGRATRPSGGISPATCAPLKSPCGGSATSSRSSGSACRKTRCDPAPPGPPRTASWGHAVLTDLDPDRHRFSELMVRASLLLAGFGRHPDPRLGWCVGPPGTPEPWDFRWNRGDFDFNMGDPREVLRIQPVHGSSQARGVPAPRRPEPERGGAIAVAPVKRHDRASKRVSL